MTANYHTPIAIGAAANAAIFNAPYGQLDAQISINTTDIAAVVQNLLDTQLGIDPITQLNLNADTTLTISGGSITVTRSMHLIDTEGAASADDLDAIAGGVDGDFLVLSIVNAARVVTIRHNIGANGIYTAHQGNIILDDIQKKVVLFFDATNSRWVQNYSLLSLREQLTATFRPTAVINVPQRVIRVSPAPGSGNNQPFLAVQPRGDQRSVRRAVASGTVLETAGIGTLTVTGTPTASPQTDSVYVNFASGAAIGNLAGITGPTFNLCRRQHYSYFAFLVRTTAVISVLRIWIGLFSAAVGAVDTLGATQGFGFRYSTVVTDPAWMYVTSNGTTTTATTTGVGITTNTRYLFEAWIDDANEFAYFSINGAAAIQTNATLPAAATDLGLNLRVETREAVAKNIGIARIHIDHD